MITCMQRSWKLVMNNQYMCVQALVMSITVFVLVFVKTNTVITSPGCLHGYLRERH